MGKTRIRKPGKPRAYTPETLMAAVVKYFASISRIVPVVDMVPSGEVDKYGHPVLVPETVFNALGEPMKRTEFLTPPTVLGLCLFLNIHRDTWNSYCSQPEYSDTTTYVRGRMQCWREEQLLTRKDVAGLKFDLENNYGYRDKQQLEVRGMTLEELLRQEEGGQEF